jgi:hypothetical protein
LEEPLTLSMSRRALMAAVDAVLRHILDYGLTDCHNLELLTVECSSDLCAADVELLREAQRHGVSIEERLLAVRRDAQAVD